VLGSHRRPVEREQAPTLEDAIEDSMSQVLVVQHVTPSGERFIRGEDHRAFLPMAIVHHVKEHVGSIRSVREIPHFVDD